MMNSKLSLGLLALLTVLAALAGSVRGDGDTLLPPPSNATGTPLGLVLIQGAQIATAPYAPLVHALQAAADGVYRIWACIPASIGDLPEPLQIGSVVERGVSAIHKAGLPEDAAILYAGHSLGANILQDWIANRTGVAGLVLMGDSLSRSHRSASGGFGMPVLAISGMLDGLYRVTRQAESYYHLQQQPTRFPVVVVDGMSHMQFASGTPPALVKQRDLAPTISYDDAHAAVAAAMLAFAEVQVGGSTADPTAAAARLKALVQTTAELVAPLVRALEQEGYQHFQPACNSDYPMPLCPAYPRYPHAAPAGNTPQLNCSCGTPFVAGFAQPSMAGVDNVTVVATDAQHSVSDVHPVHLPHIWHSCAAGEQGCSINVTTVTQPIYSSFDSLDTGFYEISATELRVKLKSRETMRLAAGYANVNFTETDVASKSRCREINELSYSWALNSSSPAARARFEKIGVPLRFGDDIFLGNAGPVWIDDPLRFDVAKNNSFAVVSAPCNHTPKDYIIGEAAGYHYCKVLSPARAIEWIYIDGLRARGGIQTQ